MAKTISQRISLEGSEELQKQLVALGQAGAQAFQQIQKAAEKPIADPAQIAQTKQAVDELVDSAQSLARQFQPLNDNIKQFGATGTQATQQVTTGLNQTSTAAAQASTTIQQAGQSAATAGANAGRSLLSGAQVFGIAAAGIVAAMSAIVSSLTQGAAETSKEVSDQAAKLSLTIPQMQQLRTAFQGTSIASKDLGGSIGKVADLMATGAGGAQFLAGSLRQQTIAVKDGFVTISAFGMRTKDRMFQLKNEAHKAATELRLLGVSGEAIATGDTLRGLREIAANIDRQTDETQKAKIGTKAFGDSWRETTDALIQSMLPIDRSTASLAELGKLNRQLSEGDVGLGKAFLAQTNDLSNALKAIKDQIGALFLGPATTKAKWLTDLVDGTAELLRRFLQLDAFGREGFLADLGEGPAQSAFKILVALGRQLAAIWTNVLVPAGRQLVNIVKQVTGNLEGATTAQVAAGFITLTASIVGLALALRLAGVALTPLSLLFSVFSGFGPILLVLAGVVALFWSQFKSAADTALSWIPGSLQRLQRALTAALSGDFTAAWVLFSGSAEVAFDTIIQRIGETQGVLGDFMRALTGGVVQIPWIAELRDGLAQIGKDLPAAIELIVKSLIALGRAATNVAGIINKMFGTKLTGTDIGLLLIILQLTGGLSALMGIAVIAANGLGLLVSAFTLLGTVFRGIVASSAVVATGLRFIAAALVGVSAGIGAIPFAIGAAIVALSGLVIALVALNWSSLQASAVAAWNAIVGAVQRAGSAIFAFAASLGSVVWDSIASAGTAAWNAIVGAIQQAGGAVSDFVGTIAGIVWDTVAEGAGAAFDAIAAAVKTGVDAIGEFASKLGSIAWDAFASSAVSAWNAVISVINRAIAAVLRYISLSGGAAAPGGGGGGAMAHGGLMGGRGTGTSDSNLVWLSRGEHVMPARAVRQPGMLAFLEALRRSGGDLSRVMDRMGHFALGGLVPRPMAIPAFASGGLVGGGNNVTIQFPGLPPIGGLRASSGVVDELRKAAALAQVRSGGRKPSRYS